MATQECEDVFLAGLQAEIDKVAARVLARTCSLLRGLRGHFLAFRLADRKRHFA